MKSMKLREEYEALCSGFPWKDKEILYDTDDSFSYMIHNKHGEPIIVGWNRNTEIFWRNKEQRVTKIYLAAPWSERPTARSVREKCKAAGLEVTSRWLDFPGDSHDPKVLQEEALHDYDDVRQADVLLLLNLQKRGEETSGHAVETGMALAWGKPVFMVGETSNVFHYHPRVRRFELVDDAIKEITNDSL